MCHAEIPGWEGLISPPKGVMLETERQIASHAREIYLQAGRSHAMPPPNAAKFGVTLNQNEREMLVNWYQTAVSGS
jgi:uncharacterized membrane protein